MIALMLLRQKKVSLKVTFFALLAILGKILTMDNINKQCIMVINWRCMYKKSGKSDDRL